MKFIYPCVLFLVPFLANIAHAQNDDAPLIVAQPLISSNANFSPWQYSIGGFLVSWQGNDFSNAQLVISSTANPDNSTWQSLPGSSFVMASVASVDAERGTGYSHMMEKTETSCQGHSVKGEGIINGSVAISGVLDCSGIGDIDYSLTLSELGTGQLQLDLKVESDAIGRSGLLFISDEQERVFGFGEQFSDFDFKGKRVPIMVDEQGLSRGAQPLTDWFDSRSVSAAGEWYSTYAPIPHFITTDLRSLMLENAEFSVIDLRDNNQIAMEAYSNNLVARLIIGDTPLDIIERFTNYSGRMRALPEWSTNGLILGIQGGTDRILTAVSSLQDEDASLSAVWMQDWEGQRRVAQGERLWWNWELDTVRYPRWEDMVGTLKSDGIRVMGYINPYLHELESAGKEYYRRNLSREAMDQDFLIRRIDGTLATTGGANFLAYVVDVTNPDAREWLKDVIKTELLGAGLSGWMADFGEALPLDAALYSGESPTEAHNRYPEYWATLNREAIEEAGMGDEAVFFMRAAYTRSPGASTLFWAGDQTSNWDNYDGIKTSVTALLTSGLSGFAFNHSDVGGWLSIDGDELGAPVSVRRTKELMLRWIELGAFQSIFRTHEGLRPHWAHQFDTDKETLEHIARFSNVYNAWHEYRRALVDEAADKGWPLVRHPFLHNPQDQNFWRLSYQQYMIGSELWVAPVLDEGAVEVAMHLPEGNWVHAFTGEQYVSAGTDDAVIIPAPIGTPAVLYREGSVEGEQFRQNMIDSNVIEEGN
jgi:alpha-glucosidase